MTERRRTDCTSPPPNASGRTAGAGRDGAARSPTAASDEGGDDDSGWTLSAAASSKASVSWGVAPFSRASSRHGGSCAGADRKHGLRPWGRGA